MNPAASTMNPADPPIGHETIRKRFAIAIAKGRLGGSFLFVGNRGVGKRTFANWIAQSLLCEAVPPAPLQPCGHCDACVQVAANTHPDLIRLGKPEGSSVIPLKLLIGDEDTRMRAGFCYEVRLKPYRGRRKVAIIEDADDLHLEGANSLLKTLEEPPADAIIILISTSEQRQLPTIRSRCQTFRFESPRGAQAARFLREIHGIEADTAAIDEAIEIAAGDMQLAARLLSEGTDPLRQTIDKQLSPTHPDPGSLRRVITAHVEAAGKPATVRRDALREVFSMAIGHYRRRLRHEVDSTGANPFTLNRLDRSLRAMREVDRNANQTTLIECYATDIAVGMTGDRGGIGS
jgi:DNA polymerase-3 subunit delta'